MTLLFKQEIKSDETMDKVSQSSIQRSKEYYDQLLLEIRRNRQKSNELQREIFNLTEAINAEVSKKDRLCFNVSEAAASDSLAAYQVALDIWNQYRLSVDQSIEKLIEKIQTSHTEDEWMETVIIIQRRACLLDDVIDMIEKDFLLRENIRELVLVSPGRDHYS